MKAELKTLEKIKKLVEEGKYDEARNLTSLATRIGGTILSEVRSLGWEIKTLENNFQFLIDHLKNKNKEYALETINGLISSLGHITNKLLKIARQL